MSHWESMAALTSLAPGAAPAAALILRLGAESGRLVHVEHIAARTGQRAPWPDWVPAEVTARFSGAGVPAPWAHQAVAADLARSGQNVIISTPAASGKSLGYLLPALTAVLEGATALYIAPTPALAADQLRGVRALAISGGAPPLCIPRGRGRSPLTSCAPPARSALTASGRRCWTGIRPPRSATGPGPTPPTCSPPRTCCTTCCCRGMPGGTGSSAGCST